MAEMFHVEHIVMAGRAIQLCHDIKDQETKEQRRGEPGFVRINDTDFMPMRPEAIGDVIPCTHPLQITQGAGITNKFY